MVYTWALRGLVYPDFRGPSGLLSSTPSPVCQPSGESAGDRNPEAAYIHISVVYYQKSYTFNMGGLYEVTQDFYHEQF